MSSNATSRSSRGALRRWLPAPPSTNYDLENLQYDPYAMLPDGALVVDVGSKTSRGRYSFKTGPDGKRIVAFDIVLAPNIDFVGDAQRIPLASECADAVMLVGVLLSVQDPRAAIDEIFRILKPGGLLYISTPFVYHRTADPYDLWHISEDGLKVLCRPFEHLQSGYRRGPASAMAQLLPHFFAAVLCFGKRGLYVKLLYLFLWLCFWIKYLDRWIGRHETSRIITATSFFIGRKPLQREPLVSEGE